MFGAGVDATSLRYQLLHGLGATVLEATLRDAEQAVFAIHEFRTPETTEAKHAQNDRDLTVFLAALGPPSPGELQRITIAGAPDLPSSSDSCRPTPRPPAERRSPPRESVRGGREVLARFGGATDAPSTIRR